MHTSAKQGVINGSSSLPKNLSRYKLRKNGGFGVSFPRLERSSLRCSLKLSVTCSLNNTTSAPSKYSETQNDSESDVIQTDQEPKVVVVKPTQLQVREAIRMALPSKGRMAEDTLSLLKDCQLNVVKPNPRQYVARISQLPGLEVWFQRASDVVRKLLYGDIDLGIVGYDMLSEIGNMDNDLVILHEALGFGQCHLALGVPSGGKFAGINTLEDLKAMPWSEASPLRVVTGYQNIARRFFEEKGFEHVKLLSADGALEAAPAMGSADMILDLVSTGVTLRENNLKEIEGGKIMESQGVLVASRTALLKRPGLLSLCKELMERLEAHLTAENYYSVIANMRGESAEDVSMKLLSIDLLTGLQGPTVSPVFSRPEDSGEVQQGLYAAVVCVPKKMLYPAVKEIRKLGGSGVLVQPMTYIFDEEPPRWRQVLNNLGVEPSSVDVL